MYFNSLQRRDGGILALPVDALFHNARDRPCAKWGNSLPSLFKILLSLPAGGLIDVNKPMLDDLAHQARQIIDVQLGHQVGAVFLHRFHTDG